MKNLAIIPARLESSRFPNKPLKKICGIPMIAHCYERALLSKSIDDVYISTPNDQILKWCEQHSIPCIRTSFKHKRASERAQESLAQLDPLGMKYSKIILIQGDEPETDPNDCNTLLNNVSELNQVCNLVCGIGASDSLNKNIVKAVLTDTKNICFFSRSNIPFGAKSYFRQLGLIAFTKEALNFYTQLTETPYERIESIDMLRLLENNVPIKAVIGKNEIIGVDLEEQLLEVELRMKSDLYYKEYSHKY